ncbi:hypothetical protein HY031_01995 [Candidatus Gottesmanbacteria bacterium]|nr:hypothetical protein [Candidatus Gottesmanbacteria bacterium]
MIKNFLTTLGTGKELLAFLWQERLWWIIPFVVTLLVIALLLIFAQSSPIMPFLYTTF